MKESESDGEKKAIGPLELAFLFARVFGGLGPRLRGPLRGPQQDLSRPDPVAGSSLTAFTRPGGGASRSEAAAHILPVGHVVRYLRLRLLHKKSEITTNANI